MSISLATNKETGSMNPTDVLKASALIQQTLNLMTLGFFAAKAPRSNMTLQLPVAELSRNVTALVSAETLDETISAMVDINLHALEVLGVDTTELLVEFKKSVAPWMPSKDQAAQSNQQSGTPLDNG